MVADGVSLVFSPMSIWSYEPAYMDLIDSGIVSHGVYSLRSLR